MQKKTAKRNYTKKLPGAEELKMPNPQAIDVDKPALGGLIESSKANQESNWEQLKRTREQLNETQDKFYPLRELYFEIEGFAKLNGSVPESVINKLFVKHRVKL